MNMVVFLVGLVASVYLGLGVRHIFHQRIRDGIVNLYFGGALALMAICLQFEVSLLLYTILTVVYLTIVGLLINRRLKKI